MRSTNFYYNGEYSMDYGVYLVKTNDMQETPFLCEKEIIEENIAGNDVPYFYGINRKPITLKIALSCLEEQWTLEKRRQVARWFSQDNYKLFYAEDEPDKWCYCQYVGGINLKHNYALQGTMEIELRTNAPYWFSPLYQEQYDLSTSTSPYEFDFINNGDLSVEPELWIEKVADGDVTIQNMSGSSFTMSDLDDGETVYIDHAKLHIETDAYGLYRFNNFSGDYLSLGRGVSKLKVTGKCILSLRWQCKIMG